MNSISNTVVAKLSVAFVAAAMLFTLAAPAKAQTVEELQKLIADLTAQIAALSGGSTTGGSTSCPALTQPMTIGSQGANVTALQNYMISAGHTIPAGATGYFGTQTQTAVAAWQAANGVSPAAGYWGPISLAKYNAVCTTTGGDDDDDDTTSGDLEGGEASLEDFQGSNGDDTNLEEGQEDAPVADFEFDVEDGDVEVNRIDLAFAPSAGNGNDADDDPWDVLDEVSIWVDGDKIADMDASDEDEWSDDDPENGQHVLRFTSLDWVVREGETAEFTVAVSVAGSVDDASNEPEWNVFIPEDGIRAEDGEGIQNYTGEDGNHAAVASYSEFVSFTIGEEGGDDELVIGSSTEDPDSTTLAVEDNGRSDWMTIFAFDLDTDDSTNDIEVDTAVVGVQVSSSTYNAVVNDAMLVIDGEEYDDVTVTNGGTQHATLTFDLDGDLVIDAGDEVTAEVRLRFNEVDDYGAGTTIFASSTATGWEAEGADDVDVEGSATGETHTLRASGVTLEMVEVDETFKQNTESTTTDDEGVFTIEFDVTAFEDDIYFEKTTTRGTTTAGNAVNYTVEDSNGDEVETDGTAVAALSATADTESGHFIVREGETETFTLTVEYDPATSGFFQVQLYSVNFAASAGEPDTTQLALPATSFETDPLNI